MSESYSVPLNCLNCDFDYVATIPKGVTVAEFVKDAECPKCGVKNTLFLVTK